MHIGRCLSLFLAPVILAGCAQNLAQQGATPSHKTQCREMYRQMLVTQNGINRNDTAWDRSNRTTQLQRSYDSQGCDSPPATPQSAPATADDIDQR